ncbi:MAG: hypothetical protein ACRDFB_04670, partial [Rhabdochlamydiaceae bacterium]
LCTSLLYTTTVLLAVINQDVSKECLVTRIVFRKDYAQRSNNLILIDIKYKITNEEIEDDTLSFEIHR